MIKVKPDGRHIKANESGNEKTKSSESSTIVSVPFFVVGPAINPKKETDRDSTEYLSFRHFVNHRLRYFPATHSGLWQVAGCTYFLPLILVQYESRS